MQKSIWWIFAAVASLAALAALAAPPPNLSKALEAQQRLVYERPTDPRVFNDLGNLLVLSGRLDEAEASYLRSIELGSDRVSPRFNLGLLEQQRKHLGKAMDAYQAALEIDPAYPWAHYQIGTLYEAQGDTEQAVKSYASAFALDPQLAFAEVNPHVIENKLLTQALLVAHRDSAIQVMAPKAYDEPSHIVNLLLPSSSESEAELGIEGEDEEAMTESERVLSKTDLDRRKRLNQAAPSAGRRGRAATSRRPPRSPTRGTTRPNGRAAIAQPQRPGGQHLGTQVGGRPGAPAGGSEAKPRGETADRGRTAVPRQRVRFRPGNSSTGRLEIRLSPESEETSVAPAG